MNGAGKVSGVKLLALLLLLFVPLARGGATIEGKVAVKAVRAAPVTERYQTTAPVGPPDPPAAIVFLEGPFPTSTNTTIEVGQHHYQFAPGLIAIQKGTTVTFPNHDDDYHSVFSYSKAKRFDVGNYRKGEQPPPQKFDTPGVVRLFCQIHAHMRGTIVVLETPYFTKTDKDGNYKLTDLPSGSYTLKAWLDENKVSERPVTLKDGETLKIDFGAK